MQTLVECHLYQNNLQPETLFRAAYLHHFGKEITRDALAEDVRKYTKYGTIPPYLPDFMVEAYGAH